MFNNRVFTTVRQWGIWCIPFRGAVAQLVEHHVRNVGAEGSNPFRSTSLRSQRSPEVCACA